MPREYNLAGAPAPFLPLSLSTAGPRARAITARRLRGAAVCGLREAWRPLDVCAPTIAARTTARGDTPLRGRHYYRRRGREFETTVVGGSSNLAASRLRCRLLFMASCSSHVHYVAALDRRRTATGSRCRFLLTALPSWAFSAAQFLEQVLIRRVDPMTGAGCELSSPRSTPTVAPAASACIEESKPWPSIRGC